MEWGFCMKYLLLVFPVLSQQSQQLDFVPAKILVFNHTIPNVNS